MITATDILVFKTIAKEGRIPSIERITKLIRASMETQALPECRATSVDAPLRSDTA